MGRRMVLLLLTGAVAVSLALLLWQGNRLWLPPALQPVGHLLYRVAFFLTLPADLVTLQWSPPTGHHMPARNVAVDALMTAALLVWLGDVARRRLSPRGRRVLAVLALPPALLAAWGVLVEPSLLRVERVTVPIRDLPPWAEGLRLVHVSDTHFGPYVPLPYLERVVDTANALQPDLVVLTGDYTHRTTATIGPGIAVLGELRGRLGQVAVLGNHDHWEGAPACRQAFAGTSIRLLDGRVLYLGPDGLHEQPAPDRIALAGLGDLWEDPTPLEAVLEGVPPQTPRLVLSHNPDTADSSVPVSQGRRRPEGWGEAAPTPRWQVDGDLRVDLMLAGHTHGGQVRIPGLGTPLTPSDFGQRYAGGLVQGPHFPVIVSRGAGMAFLPVRLGVRPEIGVVTLNGE